MAITQHQFFTPESARYLASAFPQLKSIAGTSFPVMGLFYDAAADENAYWSFEATNYGSGNLTFGLLWYADTATTGNVVWGCAIAAITPETDTQDVETKAFATENTHTDSHLGTVGQRIHRSTITVSNLDSLAADDLVYFRIRRTGSSGSDTMAGDAALVKVHLSYSDT